MGENGTLGRADYHEVLLIRHFRKALKSLNPWLTDEQLQECVERMTERMSSQTLMQINEQKYQLIRDGIPVTRTKPNGETEEVKEVYNQNYRDYLDTIPKLFYYNAFVMFSNGLEARVGTIDSKWEFFHEWKRLNK